MRLKTFALPPDFRRVNFAGMSDSDVAKWLEAVAWSLCQKPDAELGKNRRRGD